MRFTTTAAGLQWVQLLVRHFQTSRIVLKARSETGATASSSSSREPDDFGPWVEMIDAEAARFSTSS
ncbi:hypothetical protein [Adhaeretor mobilis]|uniref:Uncharacterized protein n=1 Tax=Adhaeretor mobilis TaxID=1930276 RepID=A0A517MQP9_9BACT|nr:hypothetical protein [Adhaeretor mobilis]QDS97203.1 hypothetical protein HG15A2_04630 [Adhaeretor mobilis]